MSGSTPKRLFVLALASLFALSGIADAFGLAPCCTSECTMEFCPIEHDGRAPGAVEAPSCHGPTTTKAPPARHADGHGTRLDVVQRCVQPVAVGSVLSFVVVRAPDEPRPLPLAAPVDAFGVEGQDDAPSLPPASRGPPIS